MVEKIDIIPDIKSYNGILKFKSWEVILFVLGNVPPDRRNVTNLARITGYTYSVVWFTIRSFKTICWVKEWTKPINDKTIAGIGLPGKMIEFTDSGKSAHKYIDQIIYEWLKAHIEIGLYLEHKAIIWK